MKYISTRNSSESLPFESVFIKGIQILIFKTFIFQSQQKLLFGNLIKRKKTFEYNTQKKT